MLPTIVTIEDQHSRTAVLKQEALLVHFPLSEEDRRLIHLMTSLLYELEGVGLAAPQINFSKKIIAVYIPKSAMLLRDEAIEMPMHILINPSYSANGNERFHDFEACYSVTSKMGEVQRYRSIRVTYQDEQGNSHEKTATGFYARVLQHEIDHINGILITDHLKPGDLQGSMEEMMAFRRAKLSPEKQILFDELLCKRKNVTKA